MAGSASERRSLEYQKNVMNEVASLCYQISLHGTKWVCWMKNLPICQRHCHYKIVLATVISDGLYITLTFYVTKKIVLQFAGLWFTRSINLGLKFLDLLAGLLTEQSRFCLGICSSSMRKSPINVSACCSAPENIGESQKNLYNARKCGLGATVTIHHGFQWE